MAGKRQKKWKRAVSSGQLIMQPRDRDIMRAVYEHRYLSREQIQKLTDFNCTSKANLRLRKLFDHHYLSRTFLPTSHGSSKAIYSLGKKGVNIVSEELGADPAMVRAALKNSAGLKELFLSHQLNLNDVRIAFTKTIEDNADMELDHWINDHQCRQEYCIRYPAPKKKTFRPDSYFRFMYRKRIYSYFIELDQSTMSNKRFMAKTKDYLEYARSGSYQRTFGVKYFRVLVIAPSEKRIENLKKTVEGVTSKIFWFSTLNQVIDSGCFSPIWLRAGHAGVHPLMEVEK